MRQQVKILWNFIRREPRGFTFKLIKNSLHYTVQRYFYRNEFAVQIIHDFKMKLNLRDPGISRTLLFINDREREHAYLLKKITRPGDTILDLGANIGYYALMESKLVGDTGRVIAVEPHPKNFALLTDNIVLNRSRNIIPIQAAVTDQDGSTTLHVSRLSNVHSVLPSVNYAANKTVQVPSISLATLVAKYGAIRGIRMDIEGFETVILESLFYINQHHTFTPTILFELHPKKYADDNLELLLKNLMTIGYGIRYLATSNRNLVNTLKLSILAAIPTDGRNRYIVENVNLKQAKALIPSARCMVLSRVSN